MLILAFTSCRNTKEISTTTTNRDSSHIEVKELFVGMEVIRIPKTTVIVPKYELGLVPAYTRIIVKDSDTGRDVSFWKNEAGQLMVECSGKDTIIENLRRENNFLKTKVDKRKDKEVIKHIKPNWWDRNKNLLTFILPMFLLIIILSLIKRYI